MSRVRILGLILFLVGLWIFLAPFVGPAMHLNYVPPTTSTSPMHMAGMGGLSTNAIVVNRAMFFFNFVPGAALVLVGIYLIFSGQTSRVM